MPPTKEEEDKMTVVRFSSYESAPDVTAVGFVAAGCRTPVAAPVEQRCCVSTTSYLRSCSQEPQVLCEDHHRNTKALEEAIIHF